jgi:predicted O-methyltransferase YrrM
MGATMDRADKVEALLGEKLTLHFWDGQWQGGGLTDDMLRALFGLACAASDTGAAVILETGAGLSTLVFLASAPSRVVTVAPNPDLRDRIVAEAARLALDGPRLEFHVGRSEDVLPDLAKVDAAFVDMALIDGGHGMPTVFVDFCYINKILKNGAYLALDDIQLHSVRQLYLLLKNQPGFDVVAHHGKLVVLQKTDDRRFLPEWGKQPFVVQNS